MYCIKEYWRDVLKRIVVVIKYLGERGLPFRGDDETFGSAHNGPYWILVIAEFDPFLKNILKSEVIR